MMAMFGEVRQIGFMSRDIDRSMTYFVENWGVGPWFVLRNLEASMLYKGAPIEVDMSVAMANCGDLQFEVVMQHNDTPSLYTDALAVVPGLHIQHMGVWTHDVAGVQATAHAKGWTSVFETASGAGKSIFITHPSDPAVCIELSDCDPFKDSVRDAIKHIASAWDGSNPIREGFPAGTAN
jgi:Glyoxalase/Bleomycin resistance protein/Dioxygenase superfamily